MAKPHVQFFPDLSVRPSSSNDTEIEIGPLEVSILTDADKSDPLNQRLVIGFRVGQRCGGRSMIDRDYNSRTPYPDLARAIVGLLTVALDNAAEIRDAIAQEKAG